MLDLPLWDWEARRGRSLLSRSGAFPEIGVPAIVVVHRHCSSSCHVDFSPPPRAPALQSRERSNNAIAVLAVPYAGIQKAPVPLVDEGYIRRIVVPPLFAPQRASAGSLYQTQTVAR